MTKIPTTPAAPDPAHLRALVAERLGRDPIEYAIELRSSTIPPMAWNRVAQTIQAQTGVYLTQEAVRRWVRNWNAQQDTAEQAAKATNTAA